MSSGHVSTYQARILLTPAITAGLDAYADLYNKVERSLYADMRRFEKKAATFKNGYLVRFGVTARQFNAIGRNLEGKVDSVLELLKLRIQETEMMIAKAKKVIGKVCNPSRLHQKRRRLAILETRLSALKEQQVSADPRICFGSRKLFR